MCHCLIPAANILPNFETPMHSGKARFYFLLFSFGILLTGFGVQAGGRMWNVCNRDGKRLFSVFADTVYGLAPGLFCLRSGGESVVFQQDPFHPLFRMTGVHVLPFHTGYFSIGSGGSYRLASVNHPSRILPTPYRKIETLGIHVLAWTDNRVILNPDTPGEQIADTLLRTRRGGFLHLRGKGLVRIDSAGRNSFFPLTARNCLVNESGTHLCTDTIWEPLDGRGGRYRHEDGALWWADSLFLVRSPGNYRLCRPGNPAGTLFDSLGVPLVPACGRAARWVFFRKGKNSGLLHLNGKEVFLPEKVRWSILTDTSFVWQRAGKLVVRGTGGSRTSLNPTVTEAGCESEGLRRVKAGRRFGFMDESGLIRFSCRYDSVLGFSEGLCGARLGRSWGYWDRDERIRIQPHFSQAGSFRNGLAPVCKEGKWGIMQSNGQFRQECRFDSLVRLPSGRWKTRLNGWAGLLRPDGTGLLPNRYNDIFEAGNDWLLVLREGKWSLFAKEGDEILPFKPAGITIEPKLQLIIYPDSSI